MAIASDDISAIARDIQSIRQKNQINQLKKRKARQQQVEKLDNQQRAGRKKEK